MRDKMNTRDDATVFWDGDHFCAMLDNPEDGRLSLLAGIGETRCQAIVRLEQRIREAKRRQEAEGRERRWTNDEVAGRNRQAHTQA